ncbi:AsmA family protein [Solidesulfovibrio fructosivorans JJ]]|uniref:AsmA family protein n=2 Tax=Solidesulfovibrio fructosivorans TaxID=878 RepID=E1JY82_SOLFR|nr:AsmA family protein [Solidesulfovibrio fructosivorans JJ]]
MRLRRLRRLIALAAISATLAVFVLPLAARELIGAARLKAITEQTLSDALGRRVTITGDVSILFVPWFGLSMGPVAVADAPGFGDAPMLTARRVELTIRVLPLLRRVVSPGSVRVRDLTLALRRDTSGRANWDDLTAPQQTAAAEAPGWEVAPEPRDVRLENATVTYDDAVTGRTLSVTKANLKTGRSQPFDFSISFLAKGFMAGGQLECHASGQAGLNAATGELRLGKTLVETILTVDHPLVPGGATPVRVASRLTATYAPETGTLAVTDLDARLPEAILTGSATLSALPGDAKLATRLNLTLDAQGKWREILGLTSGEPPGSLVAAPAPDAAAPRPAGDSQAIFSAPEKHVPGKLSLAIDATADASGIALREATLSLPGKGRITAKAGLTFDQGPRLDATLAATDVDFDALPRPAGTASWSWPAPWPGYWPAKGVLDARIDLRHCRMAGLAMNDAHATLTGGEGLLRLYPVSIALPGGVAALDVRIDAGPDGASPETPGSLGLDARAAVTPTPVAGQPAGPPSRLRLLGRLHAEGARGNIMLQTPDPVRAAAVVGLAGLVPFSAPLDAKGTVTITPGVGRAVAKAALTGISATIDSTGLTGQITYNTDAGGSLGFDLAAEALDLDRFAALSGAASSEAEGAGDMRAEGRLRLGRVSARGIEAKNVALGLTVAAGKISGVLTGGELFGGKLSGKVETTPAGKIDASLVVAGINAARLPGVSPTSLALSGTFTAKAGFEAQKNTKGKLTGLTASIETDAARLALGTGSNRQTLAVPKAKLTLTGRDGASGPDTAIACDASLAVSQAAGFGLSDIKLSATGPLSVDNAGKVRLSAPVKIEASALAKHGVSGKAVKLALAGPITPDAGGGFSTGEVRLTAGGVPATVKVWRKGGEAAPVNFSVETGALSPRKALADWGVALPADLPGDRLAKGSFAASGTASGHGLDIKRLSLVVDDVTMAGSGTMPEYNPRRGKWDLTVDRLDWDAYFPRQATSGPPPLAERRKPLELDVLRSLALEAKIRLGWFKKGNVTFGATTITADARGGRFTYHQDSPRFYGGRFAADIRGDARDTALKTLVELKLESIEIARFLWDWAEGDTLGSGSATFILAARTSGINEMELRDNLAGNASLQITRGTLKVREPASKSGVRPEPERIPFSVFSSSWQARGGVAHSDDFLIESPRMRVSGKGNVDLRDESINLSVTAALTSGGQVPATIIGPLDNPKLTIDRSKMLGEMVYRVLQGIVSIPGKAVTRILQIR